MTSIQALVKVKQAKEGETVRFERDRTSTDPPFGYEDSGRRKWDNTVWITTPAGQPFEVDAVDLMDALAQIGLLVIHKETEYVMREPAKEPQ